MEYPQCLPTLFGASTSMRPVADVNTLDRRRREGNLFCLPPLLGALLFENSESDARDFCAAERTFLSWLRLSVFMAVVAVAVILTFHLRNPPTALERQVALPFGLIFWILSLLCLGTALGNYINAVSKYSKRQAIVQSGPWTQFSFGIVSLSIIIACVLFLAMHAKSPKE